jgi:hypothetical protein
MGLAFQIALGLMLFFGMALFCGIFMAFAVTAIAALKARPDKPEPVSHEPRYWSPAPKLPRAMSGPGPLYR